jgi:hypothetical protein
LSVNSERKGKDGRKGWKERTEGKEGLLIQPNNQTKPNQTKAQSLTKGEEEKRDDDGDDDEIWGCYARTMVRFCSPFCSPLGVWAVETVFGPDTNITKKKRRGKKVDLAWIFVKTGKELIN